MRLNFRKIFLFAFVAIAFFTPQAFAADVKVAFVNSLELQNKAPQVKSMLVKLRKEFATRTNRLVAQKKQIVQLEQKHKRDQATMSASEVKKLERDIVSRKLKLKNSSSELEQEKRLRQNDELDRFRKVVYEVVIQVAKEEKLDVVLQAGVVWTSPRANITDKVLQRLVELESASK